jgi:UDP-N-acetylglucosamine 1-carboxyvinyltransferase
MAIASLSADGLTEISELHHLDRGYEGFVDKLRALGVEVRRVEEPATRRS